MLRFGKRSIAFYNLLQSLFFSVMLLLLVVLLINNSIQAAVQYANEVAKDSFSGAVEAVEGMLDRIEGMVSNNQEVERFLARGQSDMITNRSDLSLLLSEMEKNLSDERIKVSAFWIGQKSIYTSEGESEYLDYQNELNSTFDVDGSRLFSSIQRCTGVFLIHLTSKWISINDEVVYLVPYVSNGNRLVFLFRISDLWFQDTFVDYLGHFTGEVNIYSTNSSDIFCCIGTASTIPREIVYTNPGSGVIHLSDKDIKYTAIRILSPSRMLGYMYIDNEKAFYDSINTFSNRQWFLLLAILCFLILYCVTIYFRNVIPIKNYIKKIVPDYLPKTDTNELDLIENYQQKLKKENVYLREQLDDAKGYTISHIVRRLALGKIQTKTELLYLLSCADVTMPFAYFAVLYILLPPDINKNINQIILNDACNMEDLVMLSADFYYENALIVVVNFQTEEKNIENRLEQIAEWTKNWFADHHMQNAKIGVGNIVTEASMISISFTAAAAAAKLQHQNNKGFYYMKPLYSDQINEDYYYPLLWEFIERNQVEQATLYMKKISEKISVSTASFSMYKWKTSSLIQFVSQQCKEYEIQVPENIMECIISSNSREEFEKYCSEMINYCCHAVEEAQLENQLNIRKTVVNYIQRHYCDSNFSIQLVAETLRNC